MAKEEIFNLNSEIEKENIATDENSYSYIVRTLVDSNDLTEDGFQNSLRPKTINEYVGQEKVVKNLSIAVAAAKRRGESLDHVLFHGPPGLGKTTLASIIANELGVNLKVTSGPVLEKPGDLAAILSSLNANDVLFIDEIHRLGKVVEEILYPAMEDYSIDIIIGQGPAARSVKLNLKPFTLVGATTRTGLLSAPLRDRFGIIERMDYYSKEELTKIVNRSADLLGIEIDNTGANQIAARSRGTPRIANRLLKRARDYAQEVANSMITENVASNALELLDVDELGLDKMDKLLLLTIIDKFSGGPVGVETLAAAINESKDTIEDVYEPYLMQLGFIIRTPRGREATLNAYKHFNRVQLSGSKSQQAELFKNENNF